MTFYQLTVDVVYFQPPKSSQKHFLPEYETPSLLPPKKPLKKALPKKMIKKCLLIYI